MTETTEQDYSDFNEYSNSTRDSLIHFAKFLQNAANVLVTYEFCISVIGIILNVFHLTILTRKSMRSTSTNVLMIGIGMCDFFIMVFYAYVDLEIFLNPDVDCWAPSSYPKLVMDLWASALRDVFRRLSAWLGVLIAFFRWLIVKNSLNPKFELFSKPSFAWKSILITLILSCFISSFYWARLNLVEVEPWTPASHCHNFPANYSEKQFALVNNDLFMDNDLLALKIFLFTDGTLKIVPAAVLPILTCLLIHELKETEIVRHKISTVRKVGDQPKSDHSTKIVIFMTITFIFAEGPLGAVYLFQGFLTTKPGFLDIANSIGEIFGIFIALNATTHCLICLTLSSQYRSTVKKVFMFHKKEPKQILTSVSPKISATTSARRVMTAVEEFPKT